MLHDLETTIETSHLLIFTLDGQRYALDLETVEQVVRAVAVTPLPQAPDVVLGIVDYHGEVIPVIDMRKRFRLAHREIRSNDHFIVACTGSLTLALVVDGAEGVLDGAAGVTIAPEEIVMGTEFLKGVTRTGEGLVLIHDLEALLFPHEEELLVQALEHAK